MKNTKKLHVMGAIICGLLSFGYAEEHKHWSYDEVSKWGDIANEFHACKYGKYQSPINIESQNIIPAKSKNNLHFSYLNNTAQNVVNNGHSIQVNFKSGSSFTLQNTKFELVQVHFHTPSEYTIDNKHYPMVAHLVHKSSDGQMLVVAVMFQEGKQNPTIQQIWDKMPQKSGETNNIEVVDIANLVKSNAHNYRLDGSLTTPPCTEGVIWIIPKEPMSASKDQIEQFTNIIGKNNRPVQQANGRVIIED